MTPARSLTGVALLSLCGCQSLTVLALKSFDPKPYAMPVAAQALAAASIPVAKDGSSEPAGPEAKRPGKAAPLEGLLEAADAPPPAEPVRTDIRGLGDGRMVDDRVVVTAHKEIAHRVPDYSREQVAAMVCARQSEGNAGRLKSAQRAYEMTLAAYKVREAYLSGQRSARDLDTAERKRQDAVGAMDSSLFSAFFGGRSKKQDLPKPERDGLVLENPDLYTFVENGKAVMAVSATVRNPTSTRVELPPVTLVAIDGWDFVLAGRTSLLPFEQLEAGEARSIEIRFLNPPDTTYEVALHFAPPFEYRLRRECNPASASPGQPELAPRSAAHAAAITSAIHTAAELNLLTGIYRSEAESAWNLRACAKPGQDPADDPNRPRRAFEIVPGSGGERRSVGISLNLGKFNRDELCAAWSRRLPWRESFALSEASDEAWGALLALEETRQRAANGLAAADDVASADRAFQKAYATFRALGARTLARAGDKIEAVEIAISSSTFGYDQLSRAFDGADISKVGFYVDVSGSMHNTSDAPRRVEALMLALVDRLEQPLLTFRLEEGFELAPGETRAFQERVYFSDPVRRRDSKDLPPWQVRVGAVGRSDASQ